MKCTAVIDSNVLISGLTQAESINHKIISYIESGNIIPLYNDKIIDEYKSILKSEQLNIEKEVVDELIDLIKDNGLEISNRHKDDRVFLIALASDMIKNSFTTTDGLKDFPEKLFIIDSTMMSKMIESN